jgi:hypothetical protein
MPEDVPMRNERRAACAEKAGKCGPFTVDPMPALSDNFLAQSLERHVLRDWTPAVADPRETATRHERVEQLLGENVSRASVENYLAQGCLRRKAVFERVSRGRYRLL